MSTDISQEDFEKILQAIEDNNMSEAKDMMVSLETRLKKVLESKRLLSDEEEDEEHEKPSDEKK